MSESTFKVHFYTAELMKDILTCLECLANDFILDITTTAMIVNTMDTSHIALINVFIPEESCYEYECSRSVPLGLSAKEVLKAFKLITPLHAWSLCISGTTTNGMTDTCLFVFTNGENTEEATIKTLNIDTDAYTPVDNDVEAMFCMPSDHFAKVIKSKTNTDTLRIDISPQQIVIETIGDAGSMINTKTHIGTTKHARTLAQTQQTNVRKRRKTYKNDGELTEDDQRFLIYNAIHRIEQSATEPDDASRVMTCVVNGTVSTTMLLPKYLEFFCKANALSDRVYFYAYDNFPVKIVFPFSESVIGASVTKKVLLDSKVDPDSVKDLKIGKKRSRDGEDDEDTGEAEEWTPQSDAQDAKRKIGEIIYFLAPKCTDEPQ